MVGEVWSHSGVWILESGVTPESGVRSLESLRSMVVKSGVILESGYWSLVSLRSLESGVWSHSGVWCAEVWSHSGVWCM